MIFFLSLLKCHVIRIIYNLKSLKNKLSIKIHDEVII